MSSPNGADRELIWARSEISALQARAEALPDLVETAAAEYGWQDATGQLVMKVWRVHEVIRAALAGGPNAD